MAVIETRGLVKRYNNSFTAVAGVDLAVQEGEVFGLLGPNGAGKSTLISCLCTLLRPSEGSASVAGFDVVRQEDAVRRSIGLVFQDPSIDDLLTGRENLELHARLYGVPRAEARSRISEVLSLVELESFSDKPMRTYSGGMRRRLELARGLIHYPKVLFLDEPTLGLDPQTREHLWRYIQGLARRQRITVFLTTHYMEEADQLCDRVGIIDHGRIIALDTPAALKRQLKGDALVLRVSGKAKSLAARASKLAGVQGARLEGGRLRLSVEHGESLLPKLVSLASRSGARIDSVELRQPTLNDVFLHHTGREIRAEEGSEIERMRTMAMHMRMPRR